MRPVLIEEIEGGAESSYTGRISGFYNQALYRQVIVFLSSNTGLNDAFLGTDGQFNGMSGSEGELAEKFTLSPAVAFRKRMDLVDVMMQAGCLDHELIELESLKIVVIRKLREHPVSFGCNVCGRGEWVRGSADVFLLRRVKALA